MAPPLFSLAQITAQLQRQWGGSSEGTTRTWNDGSLEYSLPDTAPTGNAGNEANGFVVMTATQKAFAREAFELWDDLIQSSLTEVISDSAQITFGYSSSTTSDGTYTSAFLAGQLPGSSTFDYEIARERVWMDANAATWPELQNANMVYGERGLETYIHEIGHALGLSHPGSYNAGAIPAPTYAANAEYSQDTLQWTVMSYFNAGSDGTVIDRTGIGTSDVDGDGINASTPLLHDIAAIQAKYGTDVTTRTGDTTYGFNSTANRGAYNFVLNPNPVIAIWDAGGIDRLDASGFTQDQRIDLHAGSFSDIGALTLNVAIAYGVTIENASGGSGNDSITGNDAANTLNGLGGNDTMFGLGDADLLHGNDGNDTLDGGFGFVDTLYGDAGDDTYIVNDLDQIVEFSGQGHDTVRSSVRWVLGDNLEDLVLTGSSSVNAFGNALANVIYGNSGNNYLQGFANLDTLIGGAGNDYYELGDLTFLDDVSGFDYDTVIETVNGGIDTVSLTYQGNQIYALDANIENFIMAGTAGMQIVGNAIGNVMTGNTAYNLFYGQGGDDTLDGSTNYDDLIGGTGNDTYILNDRSRANQFARYIFDGVGEAADEGIDTVRVLSVDDPDTFSSSDGYTLTANVENGIITGADSFTLTGNALGNALTGNAAANTLTGLDGNDTMDGGAGIDALRGGAGNDFYILNDLNSSQLAAIYSYDSVTEGANEGIDTVLVLALDNPSTISSDGYTLGANVENGIVTGTEVFFLKGNELDNRLIGNGATNTLTGLAGNDVLAGAFGADKLIGGEGNDTYVLDDLSQPNQLSLYTYDTVTELAGEGTDTVLVRSLDNPDTISTDRYTLGANVENGMITGTDSFNLNGNELDNRLTGNGAANVINGLDGNDILLGGGGIDSLAGGAGNDSYALDDINRQGASSAYGYDAVTEAAAEGTDIVLVTAIDNPDTIGTDRYILGANVENGLIKGAIAFDMTGNALANRMTGNEAANYLAGLNGNDTLFGRGGVDTLSAGNGNDLLVGGAGRDTLIGGAGADRFIFEDGDFGGASIGSADRIMDFDAAAGDSIDLSRVDAIIASGADDAFSYIGSAAFSGAAGQLRLQTLGNGNSYLYGDTTGDSVQDFVIRLDGDVQLTAASFVL